MNDTEGDERLGRARLVGMRTWAALGCCGLIGVALLVLGRIVPALELLLVGVVIGFVCSPITNALERRGVGRALGAFIALLVFLVVLVAAAVLIFPPFVSQLIEVLQHVPAYVGQFRSAFNDFWRQHGTSETANLQQGLSQYLNTFAGAGTTAASSLAEGITNGIVNNVIVTANNIFTFFLGLVVAYWLAKDYPTIARELSVIAGPRHEGELSVMLAVMSRAMGGYMRGIVITSAIAGVLSFLGFAAIGHPYASLMGITMGVLHFIPVIGPWVAAALTALLALFVSPLLSLASILVSVVVLNVTDNLISPLVMRSAVKIHPVLSLLGIVIGSAVGGVLGMMLAIPLTAAVRSLFVYYFERHTNRQLVSYDGALFQSTPFRDDHGAIQPSFDALDDDKFFESTLLVNPDKPPVAVAAERPHGTHRSLGEHLADLVAAARRHGGPKGGDTHGDSEQAPPPPAP
ncbi:AI-2E family transporter [Olsenella profusa]|uniref:PF01594 domain protein n=1 Tax=Olsenella profusa F0195 TaxID=1125712 RepID=U2V585_9ACTN|nr:AI-2E family transporter [Olsenella profusa]ERL10522.1 PF01594 domain protein [Olsenella profusa F0195]